ncbi:proline-rich protein 2-like [Budorcas taxicolor]|uniref:proline-rich protein 2-like n=1 Tax=Budorcas taxicolor TaxID=37181 RepID=UPI002284ED0B|nr:proline-rich protein 2-like [Budorcas taxicolor]
MHQRPSQTIRAEPSRARAGAGAAEEGTGAGGPRPRPQTRGPRAVAGRTLTGPRAPTEAPLPHPPHPTPTQRDPHSRPPPRAARGDPRRRRLPHSALAAAPALPQPAGRPPTRLGHQRSRRQPEAPKRQRRRRPRRGALVPGRWEASEAALTHLRLPAPPPPEAAPLPATPTVGGPELETRRGQASPGSGCGSAERTSPPPAHPPSATRATPLGPVPALALVRRRRRRPRRRGPTRQAPPPAPSLAAGEGGLGASGMPIGCVRLPSGPPLEGVVRCPVRQPQTTPPRLHSIQPPLPRPHRGPARQGRAADSDSRSTGRGSAPGAGRCWAPAARRPDPGHLPSQRL